MIGVAIAVVMALMMVAVVVATAAVVAMMIVLRVSRCRHRSQRKQDTQRKRPAAYMNFQGLLSPKQRIPAPTYLPF